MASNLIPGAEDQLGWGFDIFDAYGTKSKLWQLFDLNAGGERDVDVNGITYRVPATVSVDSTHGFSGSANFCQTTEKIAKFFQGKAQVTGSYGAFSGAVSVGYSSSQLDDDKRTYCIFDAEVSAYSLDFKNAEPSQLSSSVTNDPVFRAVRKAVEGGTWNDAAREACFAFFDRFGTHFITQVKMGGSLYYYSAVEKAYTMNAHTIETKVKAEYNGLFLRAGAEAAASWAEAGQDWVNNRTARVVGVGGNTAPMDALDPSYGTNYNREFESWRKAVETSPSPMGFTLRETFKLFPDDTAGILVRAYEEYASGRITASISYKHADVGVNGQPVSTSAFTPINFSMRDTAHLYSYVACVVDRTTGKVVASAAVDGPSGRDLQDHVDRGHSDVPPELKPYEGQKGYVLIFLWASTFDEYLYPMPNKVTNLAPSGALYNLLLTSGASEGWDTVTGVQYDVKSRGCYILVGVMGEGLGTGTEKFTDINTIKPTVGEDPLLDPATPAARLTVPFIRKKVGGKYLFTPTPYS